MKHIYWVLILLIGSLIIVSCDDKEYTTGLTENQLINSITLDVTDRLFVAIGIDTTIVHTITPDNPVNPELLWTSSDETVAGISQDGTISGKKEGTAVITVTPAIGFGVSNITMQTIEVIVIPEIIKVTAIEFTNKDSEGNPLTEIYETDQLQLTYNLLPENHTYSYLTWKSSNESIATIDKNGVVTGITPGNVTIYAYTHDGGGVVGEYDLRVINYVPVEDVTIQSYNNKLYLDQEIMLDFSYTPSSATVSTVTWSSSDESVLSVDQGKVKAIGFGTAVITATCIVNGNSASVTLTVDPGWYVWDKNNDFKDWYTPTAGAKVERKNGKLEVTLNISGTNRRADLNLPASRTAPFMLHFGNYPVLAMRTTIPRGGANTLDAVTTDDKTAGNLRCDEGITLDDGTRLIYYYVDAFSATDFVPFRTVGIKVANIPVANAPSDTYQVYWIRTFKSIAEMEEFAIQDVAAGN